MFLSMRTSMSLSDPSKIAGRRRRRSPALSRRMYPPAQWFQDALTAGSPVSVLWLLLLSFASVAILLLWIGRSFVSINSRIKSKPRGETFVMRRQVRSGQMAALVRRERSSAISAQAFMWVNTAFSYIMLLAAGVALLVKADAVTTFFEIPQMAPLHVDYTVCARLDCLHGHDNRRFAISMEG